MTNASGLASTAIATGVWASFFMLLSIIVRQVGPWRKQSIDVQEKLRGDLLRRVESLEQQLVTQAAKYEEKIAEQGVSFQAKLDSERDDNESAQMVMRHRLNNITACFDAFLMLVKANPDKAGEAVVMVEEMRAKQIVAEATEKATLRSVRPTTMTQTTNISGDRA